MSQIKKILCIEDDLFIGEMYRRSLKQAGYKVDLISEGDKGLEAAKTGNYDLILLDIMLPQKKGTEILRTLRGEGADLVPNSRIIVLTNFDQDDESKLAMQSQAEGYLIKADITPRRLLEIIKSLDT
ncbi:MAG: response regulator [Candidatus Woesebacteria bacterium]|jgi:DNA-binding response OmpR family regulator